MPKDFRFDRTTRNIDLTRMVEGIEFTEQSLWLRLGLWTDDWFLNNTLFIDWGLALSYQPPRLAELYEQIRTTALGTDGITEVKELKVEIVGRTLKLLVVCGSIYEQDITIDEVFGS